MTTAPYRLIVIVWALLGAPFALHGEELLFHSGPPVSTPAPTAVTPFPEKNPPELIKFQREFFINRARFASLPEPSLDFGTVPISAIEAIHLARKDVDPDAGLRSFIVTEVRLLKGPKNEKRPVEYYLVSMLTNGSESHRVVLMNGTVIAPKLRKLNE